MVKGVVSDFMAGSSNVLSECKVRFYMFADKEKSGRNLKFIQCLQYLWCRGQVRAIIEGQSDFWFVGHSMPENSIGYSWAKTFQRNRMAYIAQDRLYSDAIH